MKRFHTITLAVVFVVFATSMLPARPSSAQSGQWSVPMQISENGTNSWFPDITVDPSGRVHIVWASGISQGAEVQNQLDLLMYRSLFNGQWSKPNDVFNTGTGGFASRASITVGRTGLVHVLVRSQLKIEYLHARVEQAQSVQDWSPARRINNDSTVYYDAITSDANGTLHAFWNETMPIDPQKIDEECAGCADLFYRRSTNNGQDWSTPINLSETPYGSTKPQVKLDSEGGLHVVWDEGYDNLNGQGTPNSSMYRYSGDGGTTWSTPVVFTLPPLRPEPTEGTPRPDPIPNAPQQVTLGLFQNQHPIVVYRSTADNTIFYQFSRDRGQTWSRPAAVPDILARDLNDTPWDSYTMATDSSGTVHLIVSGFLTSDVDSTQERRTTDPRNRPRLLHLTWNGSRWSRPIVIASEDRYPGWSRAVVTSCDRISPQSAMARSAAGKAALQACREQERYPEWPRAVVSGGNQLHLTWFTRNGNDLHNSDHARYQVWYSVLQLASPAITPLPFFTPTPTEIPLTPTATPEPTPTPTMDPNALAAPPPEDAIAWEAPGLVVAGIAALTSLLFVVGILAIAFWWNRRHHHLSR